MKRLWKETGEVWQPPTGTTGRPHVIGEAHQERLREYLDRNPDALMRDIADFLNDECGIDVTVSTVWRTMVRLGWKENRPRAKDRDSLGQWKPTLPRDENGKPIYGPVKDRGKQKLPKKRKPTPQEALLNRVQIFAQDYMSQPRFDASHDYSHVLRVVNLSRHILRVELVENPHMRYDQIVVELAALMHDVNDYKYASQSTDLWPPTSSTQPPPTRSGHRTLEPPATPQAAAPQAPFHQPSHSPYGHLPTQTSAERDSNPATSLLDQAPVHHPEVDPSLQPVTSNQTTPSQPHPVYPSTPQTAQIRNQPALQPLSTAPRPAKDGSRSRRTIEEHLLRLRAPAPLATTVNQICSAISFSHESHNPDHIASVLAQHPELAIVQDADRLDALGAMGIGRAFTFGGARGRRLEDSVEHFDEKLAHLEGLMKTGEGRRLARVRLERVNAFRGWWEEEAGFASGLGGAEDEAMRDGDDHDHGDDDGGAPNQDHTMDMSADGRTTNGSAPHSAWQGRDGPSSSAAPGHTNGYGGPSNGYSIDDRTGGGSLEASRQDHGQNQNQGQGQRHGHSDHPNRQLMQEAGML